MLILNDIQTQDFQNATGFCPTSPDFLNVVNRAIPRLLQRGDWPGTLLPVRVCVRAGCVTWPRYVGQVRSINACHGNIAVHNVWYQFLPYQGHRHIHDWQGWCGRERRMMMQSYAPTYNDIYGPGCYVRAYPQFTTDTNATITIFGTDNNNQPLQTLNADGTVTQGVTIYCTAPFGTTQVFVSRIDRVVKSMTQGNITLYAFDTATNLLYDLAVYEPSETVPSYLRYKLDPKHSGYSAISAGCEKDCSETIIAMVKLKYVPALSPMDGLILLPGSEGAIKLACKAVKFEDADDYKNAREIWGMAIEEMNRNLEDYSPDAQFSAINNVFGGLTARNKQF